MKSDSDVPPQVGMVFGDLNDKGRVKVKFRMGPGA